VTLVVEENVSLRNRNTLGLDVKALRYCRVRSEIELKDALAYARNHGLDTFILGGGSNIVLARNLDVLVISMEITGCEFSGHQVTAMAGENWHEFVELTIEQGLYGLENLSLIPGLVGAAPIQNIGAYGVELSDRFMQLSAVDKASGESLVLDKTQCQFSYRDSIFKHGLRDQLIITSITLGLDGEFCPVLEYADLQQRFSAQATGQVSAMDVRDAVIAIRLNKLPDPEKIGNVGSFFKNPEISAEQWNDLRARDDTLNSRVMDGGIHKVSAAALIDKAGLKGMTKGAAEVSRQHALVIVNQGTATGQDVILLADKVIEAVKNRFNVTLEVEPIVVS